MQLVWTPPVVPPLVRPAVHCPIPPDGGWQRNTEESQLTFWPPTLQQGRLLGSQWAQTVAQPASDMPPLVAPPDVPPPPVMPPMVPPPVVPPPPLEAPAEADAPPLVEPAELDADVEVEEPPVPLPPVVQAALSGYWQMPLAPQSPLGQSLPASQVNRTQAGGSIGQAASEKARIASARDFTM